MIFLLIPVRRSIWRIDSPFSFNFRNAMRLVRAGEMGSLSKGGMDSKLRAVKAAVAAGIDTFIANGRRSVLPELAAGKSIGTFFPGCAL